ncbi:MAG: site-2 protease family protein [Candidatus Aenigmarchaeota archaeon]|nr:site-2 protease family protein [Candidatus Aenigmarchaeota archaeon]
MIESISFLIFICIIALLILKDRKNIKLEGIIIIRRTKKGKRFIEKLAKKHARFFRILSVISIVVSFPVMLFGTWFLVNNAFNIVHGVSEEGVMLVLPGPVSDVQVRPGMLIMPWWFWVIGIFAVMIPHEFSHGIMARLENIKIKSLGWLLLLFLPGAFCEPDEKQLKKSSTKTKISVYSAGSFANFIVGASAFLLSYLIIVSCFQASGLIYGGVIKDYPAYRADMTGAIKSINGIPINSADKLGDVLRDIEPNTNIRIETTSGVYNLTAAKRPDGKPGAFIGITQPYKTYYEPNPMAANFAGGLNFLMSLLTWVFILSIGIGVVNLLPIKPFDGGLILEAVVQKFSKKKSGTKIANLVSIIVGLALIFNIIGPYIV